MTKGRLQQTVAHYRSQLLAHNATSEAALERAYQQTLKGLQVTINHMLQQIEAKQQVGEQIPLSWLYEQHRMQTFKHLLQHHIDHFAATAQLHTLQAQQQAVILGQQAAKAQLQATVPKGAQWRFAIPSHYALRDIVGVTRDGSPLADLFRGFGKEAAEKASDALIAGIMNGDHPRIVARSLQDALDVPRWRALTIARTEQLRAYRSAGIATMQTNSDVVRGWVWVAGPNACAACVFMSGSEHSLDDDMDSHVNCRCVQAPLTRSWSDILGDDAEDIEDTSLDVADGSEWFDQQDEKTQRAILGSDARYQAYKDGVSLSDMVGVKHDPRWGDSVYVKPMQEVVRTV